MLVAREDDSELSGVVKGSEFLRAAGQLSAARNQFLVQMVDYCFVANQKI
jgi:hypothetical protein